jgi:hypothetical protein
MIITYYAQLISMARFSENQWVPAVIDSSIIFSVLVIFFQSPDIVIPDC